MMWIIGSVIYLIVGVIMSAWVEACEPSHSESDEISSMMLATFFWPLLFVCIFSKGWLCMHRVLVKGWKKILKKD